MMENYNQKQTTDADFESKDITCCEETCGVVFEFSAGEQKFYADHGYTHEPRRCPDCRKARKVLLAKKS